MKRIGTTICLTTLLLVFSTAGFGDLVHRYSFTGNVYDSVGGAHGTLYNWTGLCAYTNGELAMGNSGQSSTSGSGDYVDLPNGIISALGRQATIECWVTWTGSGNWDRVFDFGTSNAGENSSAGGDASTYIFLTPQGGNGVLRLGYRNGPTRVENVIDGPGLSPGEHHLSVTWNNDASLVTLYLDGQPVGSNSPLFSPADMPDNNNWLGRSQWPDPLFRGRYNEVRIWNHAMTPEEVWLSYAVGPDQIPATRILVEQSDGSTEVSEEGLTDTFTVVLQEPPSAEVEVTFRPQTDDLELNGGYPGDPVTLTFSTAAWAVPQTVQVAAAADSIEEGSEGVLIEGAVESSDSLFDDTFVSPVFVTIIDTQVNPCPPGDIDGDCRVDMDDLQTLAVQWLSGEGCSGPGCGDVAGADGVNLEDLSLLARTWMDLFGPVVINEFMAANASRDEEPTESWEVFDETGEAVDWIELYNVAQYPVSLEGWYLTDDSADLTKWAFPAQVQIPARSCLLIYASGKDTVNGSYYHTNFSLDQYGEYLALVSPDGIACEYADADGVYPPQGVNISYGLFDYFTSHRYFFPATPGQPNTNSAIGIAPDTRFSADRGFYSAPFSVAITTDDPDALIRYTVDGSTPSLSNGTLYTSPILIDRTTTLRAASFKAGYLPGNVDTQTYLFVSDILTQSPQGQVPGPGWPANRAVKNHRMDYGMDPDVVNSAAYRDLVDDALLAIPTLSLVSDLENWFNPTDGVYVSTEYLTRTDGHLFEKPCSLELIYPDGSEGFQIDCGVRIRGGASRNNNNPKHALRLFFRSQYGAGKLEYPMFGDEGVEEFDKLDLRTAANYSWSYFNATHNFHNTFLRDEFSRHMQGKLGRPNTKGRYYHLYLNGQYWGLYQTEERADSRFAASYLGGSKEDYDVVKVDFLPNWDHPVVASDGNLDAYRRLYDAVRDGLDDAEYFRLQGQNLDGSRNEGYERLLDADNLIDYMIITYYTADYDGPGSRFVVTNNFYGIYNRSNPDGFKWIEHDSEHSFGVYESEGSHRENMVTPLTSSGSNFTYFNPHWLHEQLANQCPEYRLRFADRVQELFFNGGQLTPDNVWAQMAYLGQQIETAIIAESARWGDANASPPRTHSHWLEAVRFLKDYIYGTRSTFSEYHATSHEDWPQQPRPVRVQSQLRSAGWFPNLNAPPFSQQGGYVASGYPLTISNPNAGGTIYYTLDGTDPRQGPASQADTVLVAEDASKRVLVPSGPVSQWNVIGYAATGWTSGGGAVGYENSPGDAVNYSGLISGGINVRSAMYNVNTTCYIRIPFEWSGGPIRRLVLRMRYDDGFVAFLNGVEIARDNVNTGGAPEWDTAAITYRDDSIAKAVTEMDVSDAIPLLQAGSNLLAIQGLNSSANSSDFLVTAELTGLPSMPGEPSENAVVYTGSFGLAESTEVKARIYDGTNWSAMNRTVFSVGPVSESLRVTELMYHPADPNGEFLEIHNIGAETVNLKLVTFDEGITHRFASLPLGPGGFLLLVRDMATFSTLYPDVPGDVPVIQWNAGALANAGERITFRDAAGAVIQSFQYSDDWYPQTDGDGFSLTCVNPLNPDLNAWSEASGWTAGMQPGGTPGREETVLAAGSIVINEVLAHSHDAAPDWIELYNTTASPIMIGGWYLSDDESSLMKYRIPDGHVIEAYGYRVYSEDAHFGGDFALSENGETVCLSSAADGAMLGYQVVEDFGASLRGVSFGRYQKSTGDFDFVSMVTDTPGAPNSGPAVGPVVISEIMYHPQNNADAEYVELLNITDSPVDLWTWDKDVQENVPWRLRDEGGFVLDIPGSITLPAGARMLLLKDLAAFEAEFGPVPSGVPYAQWQSGSLSNGGEKIDLLLPGEMGSAERFYIRVERVNYSDDAPWPAEPDGQGKALGRIITSMYSNDPGNWQAVDPSPGE